MADHDHRGEHPGVVDELDAIQARERQRRREVLRGPRGGHALVSVPDGGHRGGRKALRDALRPWQFASVDEDIDGQT